MNEAATKRLLESLEKKPVFLFDAEAGCIEDCLVGYVLVRNGEAAFCTSHDLDYKNLKPWFRIMGRCGNEEDYDVKTNGNTSMIFDHVEWIELFPSDKIEADGWLEKTREW